MGRHGDQWAVPGATIAHEDFSTVSTKAAVLEAMGRESDADALIEKALYLPGTDAYSVYAYGMGLLRRDKKDQAMKIFVFFNQQQHPQAIGPARIAFVRYRANQLKCDRRPWSCVIRS